jgi:hypothetical protein
VSSLEILVGTAASLVFIFVAYRHCGWINVSDTYKMWFTRKYWTDYNIVEAAAWSAKALIIIPGLLFGIQVWWFFVIALLTSLALIWASNKKLLPSLIAFNTIWVWLACVALAKHLM